MISLSRFLTILGSLLILFGGFLVYQRYTPQKLAFANLKTEKVNYSTSYPTQIIIPSLKINNAIIPSKIVNGNWETTTDGISFLSSSPRPGSMGNSILYGHNWESLLGRLPQIKPGQEIDILFSNGKLERFKVIYTQEVNPTDTSILANSKDKRITIYTCSGFLDSKRFVATAILTTN